MQDIVVIEGELSLTSSVIGEIGLSSCILGEIDKVIATGGHLPDLQEKEATPSEEEQLITADTGYDGLLSVTINPIPQNYGRITWNGSYITVS